MRLTGRGGQVLAGGALLYGLGVALGHPLSRALAGVCLGAVTAGLFAVAGRTRLRVSREVFPDRVPCGGTALARLVLRNEGRRRVGAVTATDRVGGSAVDVVVGGLGQGETAVRTYELPTSRRGRHDVGPLVWGRQDLLGLARVHRNLGGTATLWVHPRLHPASTVAEGSARAYAGTETAGGARGSIEFRSVREYVVGDEPRHLHWKSTARTGQLMVRDLVDPVQPGLAVLLDTRVDTLAEDDFEQAVEVAASLGCAAASAGHAVRLRTSGGLDLATGGGVAAARELLDALAEVGQDQEPFPPPREAFDRSGGCLVFVTGPAGVDEIRAVGALRSRFRLVIAVAIGARETQPGPVLTIGAPDAAAAVRHWNAAVA